ncbi:MAG: hypothetical protein AAFR91_08880 [Pseudomonadota bacterium]
MNAGFEEKSAWVQFGALVLVLGSYFLAATKMYSAGVNDIRAYVPVFSISVVLLVVTLIAGNIVAIATSKSDQADERDRMIAWRSEYLSSWVMGLGIIGAITAMVFKINTVLIAHGLLASLLLSTLLCMGLRILFYRRGV